MKIGPLEFTVHKGSDALPPPAVRGTSPNPQIEFGLMQQGMDLGRDLGPGRPLNPWEGYGTQPRSWDYPMAYNVVTRPRVGRMAFYAMDTLTTNWDVARMCVAHRIRSFQSFDWSIVPSAEADGVDGAVIDAEIAEAYRRMRRPDGRTPYRSWIAKLLADLLRYDAPALWKRRDMLGRPIGLEVVSGTTIAPLLNYQGNPPEGDAPAYLQFIKGLPWDWVSQRDMIYLPFNPQPDSPYGWAPIEDVVLIANEDIRMTMNLLDYWTEGNIPGGLMEAPPDVVDPSQVDERQKRFNARVKGNVDAKVQVHYVESGTKYTAIRPAPFDENAYLWGFRKGCAAYGVVPQDMGITLDVNRANGETQMDIQERIGDRPLALHIDSMLTSYLQEDVGLRVEFQTSLGAEKEDRLAEAQVWKIYIENAIASPDDARQELTGLPIDTERPVPRGFFSPRTGFVPLASVFSIAGPNDPATGAPVETQPLTVSQFDGAGGLLPDKTPGGTAFKRAPLNPDDPNFPQNEGIRPGTDVVGPPPAGPTGPEGAVAKATDLGVQAAGLVVRAADTGRVLMLQRAMVENDPAAGMWEWPGGGLEEDESPWEGAWREWQEEVGCPLPEGAYGGSWTVGNYQGFAWEIPHEADLEINAQAGRVLNPDDPDGDLIETAAWFRPSQIPGMPALRPIVATSDWQVVAGFPPVVKDASGGITVATGIEGIDLEGEEDELPAEVKKELARWRDNARGRVRQGRHPRPFASELLSVGLTRQVWDRLAGATTRQQVDEAFAVRKAGNGPKVVAWPSSRPGYRILNRILDHYAPLIRQAIREGLQGLEPAIREYYDSQPVVKVATPVGRQAARTFLRQALSLVPGPLQKVLAQMTGDTYLVAAKLTADLEGAGPPLQGMAGAIAGANWDDWQPGWAASGDAMQDPGLAAVLARQGIGIVNILDSTVDQIGTQLADSLANGDNLATAAKGIVDFLDGDLTRAYLVADTEMCRAMSGAQMSTYRQNAVAWLQWLGADDEKVCDECQENVDQGPIATGDVFPSGDTEPPAHPRCRCAVVPAQPPDQDQDQPPADNGEGED